MIARALLSVGLAASLFGCTTTDVDDLGVAGATRSGDFPTFAAEPRRATPQFTEAERGALTRELNAEADPARRQTAAGENARFRSDVSREVADAASRERSVSRQVESSGSASSGQSPAQIRAAAAAREEEMRKRFIVR